MIKQIWNIAIIALVFSSCSYLTHEEDKRETAARVYDKILYEEVVLAQIPINASAEDSVNIRNSVVNSWIERQLMVKQAELNLTDNKKDVDKKLEKYKNDLLIFTYQNQLLLEKLDTAVSDQQVETYYESHKEEFQLAGYIVKVNYVKLDSASSQEKKVTKWLMSDDESDFDKLEDYCYLHSANFHLDDNWMYFDVLLKEVPIVTYNKEKLLKNKKLIEIDENGEHYIVRIVDYKLKDGLSPLSLEKPNIKRIILNNRKILFLENLRMDIYEKAKKSKEIEISVN